MGDTHFLLRHAIVGAIFLLFGWTGWWIVDATHAWAHRGQVEAPMALSAILSPAAAALWAISAPIIGISIQGVRLLWDHRRWGGVFTDDGRKVVAEKMRDIFRCCRKGRTMLSPEVWDLLIDAPDDSLFVWLYHRSAPVDLIEWARRRRSYHYLGVNLVFASGGGLIAGALARVFADFSPVVEALLLLFVALVWCKGAWSAADLMRRDVDRMELLWAAARVDPELKKCLEAAFGTLIDETFSGSDPARRREQV
jgi:hypothetical protein